VRTNQVTWQCSVSVDTNLFIPPVHDDDDDDYGDDDQWQVIGACALIKSQQ